MSVKKCGAWLQSLYSLNLSLHLLLYGLCLSKKTRDLGRKSWGSKHIKEKELAGYDSLQSNNL